MTIAVSQEGGCACGAVRFVARGEPERVGLCHCTTCRKAHAAAFNPFVIYLRERVEIWGDLSAWRSSAVYERLFCPVCGSRIAGQYIDGSELELSLGSFDETSLFEPQYESWVIRRENWLPAQSVPQNDRDPPEPLGFA